MNWLYAALGAVGEALLVQLGPRFHIGPMFFDGLPGVLGAACAGALVLVIIRLAIRKQFGPIIP